MFAGTARARLFAFSGTEAYGKYTVVGWTELKSTLGPKDTDRDGVQDGWEKKNGLNPNNPADRRIWIHHAGKVYEPYSLRTEETIQW